MDPRPLKPCLSTRTGKAQPWPSVLVMANTMDTEFLALMVKYAVPQDVIDNFAKSQCFDHATFATWGNGDTEQAIMSDAVNALMDGVDSVKGDRVVASKLKQLWRACDKIASKVFNDEVRIGKFMKLLLDRVSVGVDIVCF